MTAQNNPTSAQLEGSFFIYAMIDIALIIISVVAMVIEVKHIFTFSGKK